MKHLLIASVAITIAAFLYFVFPVTENTDTPQTENETIQINYYPVYEHICEYGHPILVTGWSLDEITRFIHLKNYGYKSDDPAPAQYPYFYLSLSDDNRISNGRRINDVYTMSFLEEKWWVYEKKASD